MVTRITMITRRLRYSITLIVMGLEVSRSGEPKFLSE